MYRKLIKEQAPPSSIKIDPLLKRALDIVCFPGFEEVTGGYQNRAAIGRWSQDKSKYVYIQSDLEDKDLFLVTEVDSNGNLIQSYQNECKKITGNVFKKEIGREDQARIDSFLKQRKYLFKDDPNANPNTHTWTDINTDTDAIKYLGPELVKVLTDGKPYMMWKPNAFGMAYEDINDVAKTFVDYLKNTLQAVDRPDMGKEGNYIKCDLKNTGNAPTQYGNNCYKGSLSNSGDYATKFTSPYTIYLPKNATQGASEYDEFDYQTPCKDAKENTYGKTYCETCIDKYYRATKAGVGKSPDPGFPEIVNMCLARNEDNFPKYKKVIQYLRGDGLTSELLPWKIKNTSYKQKKNLLGTVKVNEDTLLTQTIFESLELAKEKKRKLMLESVVVENRLKTLTKGRNLRNKKVFNKFLNEFLIETAYYNKKGFNQELISEQFTDMLKSFFTGPALGGIMGYVKEYAVKWLLGKLGLGTTGWIAEIISTTIGNIPIGEITKITDCNFVVPILAKSIAETMAKKFITNSESGDENAIVGVIRNTTFEFIDDIPFVQSLENGLAGIICPIWDQLVGKLGSVSNKLTSSSGSDVAKSSENLLKSSGSMMNNISSMLGNITK